MESEKIILPESPEAAKLVTLTLWESRQGKLFNKEHEDSARYDGSTHSKCECGGIAKRPYFACEPCRSKFEAERFAKLEKKKWDGESPICLYRGDNFFYSYDELVDYCADICHEQDKIIKPEDLMLVHCKPCKPRVLEGDFFEALWPEDDNWDLPKAIYDAMDEFNQTVKDQMPPTWEPSNIAVIL